MPAVVENNMARTRATSTLNVSLAMRYTSKIEPKKRNAVSDREKKRMRDGLYR